MGDVDEETGRLLSDRYRLGEVLGRGGMGTVWRARDEVLGRAVAVKELRFPSGVEEDEKRRLITRTLREAKAIARIRNSGAITIYDVVDEDDRPWIVMELVEGRSLAEVVRDDGPLTPHRAAEVGLAVLDVLRAAHREGILHRDVKPSNVLIAEENGRAVLTDFGIAKVEGDPSVTSTGMLVGAPSYISPERARGRAPGPPSDLWSLGGLLYAAVEGHPPYDKGSALATLTAVMTEPLDPPERAGALAEVIHRLLVKDPDKRLDEPGARAMLTAVLQQPEAPAAPEVEAERTAVLPAGSAPGAADASPPPAARSEGSARAGRPPRPAPRAQPPAARPSTGSGSASRAGSRSGAGTRPGPRPSGGGDGGSTGPLANVSRRTLLIVVAVVAALAVLATVLVITLNSGDDDPSDQGGSPGAADSQQPGDASSDPQGEPDDEAGKDEGENADKDGEQGANSPSPDPETSPDGIPEGYRTVTDDRFHFRMALPEGWQRTGIAGQNSGGVYTAPGGGYPKAQVDFNGSPSSDAVTAWEELEPATQRLSDGYRRLSIVNTVWRNYPTVADWKFERVEKGTKVRIQNRGFTVDDQRGYAIMITCRVEEWDSEACTTLRETAYRTFQPAD